MKQDAPFKLFYAAKMHSFKRTLFVCVLLLIVFFVTQDSQARPQCLYKENGTSASDCLKGSKKKDRLVGKEGRDFLYGKGGRDVLKARDGEKDFLFCGKGRDRAFIDQFDKTKNCEKRKEKRLPDKGTPPFEDNFRSLEIRVDGNGQVKAFKIDCPFTCQADYYQKKEVTLNAEPLSGHQFVGFYRGDNLICQSSTCSLELKKYNTITAVFAETASPALPETLILSGPEDNETNPTFTFSGTGTSFQCRFDGWLNWQDCSSPATFPNLAPGLRTFEVRAVNLLGSDPSPASWQFVKKDEPEPEPESSDYRIQGTGKILQEDLALNSNFLSIWGNINPSAERVKTFQNGGDTFPLIDGTQNSSYRQISVKDNDRGENDDPLRERVHVGSRQNGFYKFREGDHVILYLSFRLQKNAPYFPQPSGNGAYSQTQMWQLIHDRSCGQSPRISMSEYSDHVQIAQARLEGGKEVIWSEHIERGVWHRMAIRLHISSDKNKGTMQVFGDVDEGNKLKQLTPLITTNTTHGGSCGSNADLFIGRYQNKEVGESSIDFANIQLTEWNK